MGDVVNPDPYQDKGGFFAYKPTWRHPIFDRLGGVSGCGGYVDEGTYNIVYRGNRIVRAYIPFNGSGARTESESHEVAHMIDLAFRGQHERLLLDNYGMSFDESPTNAWNAIKRELGVMAIQRHLLLSCGFGQAVTQECIEFVIRGIVNLNIGFMLDDSQKADPAALVQRMNKYCAQRFRKLTMEQIENAYESVQQFFDKKCLKSLRRSV